LAGGPKRERNTGEEHKGGKGRKSRGAGLLQPTEGALQSDTREESQRKTNTGKGKTVRGKGQKRGSTLQPSFFRRRGVQEKYLKRRRTVNWKGRFG